MGFDPRLRDGGDSCASVRLPWRPGFDPRLRDGGDPPYKRRHPPAAGFDPRLRDGGDVCGKVAKVTRIVSIHASVMEATWSAGLSTVSGTSFRSTPP